jgi:hypothetical protein
MSMVDSKFVEVELLLSKIAEKQQNIVIRIDDKCAHLFIRHRPEYHIKDKVIIVMEHLDTQEFKTIREMVTWLMDNHREGHYGIHRFAENLFWKVEEHILNEL